MMQRQTLQHEEQLEEVSMHAEHVEDAAVPDTGCVSVHPEPELNEC